MIKVVELISSLSDGGAETLVKDYACMLDKNKFEVTVLCIYPIEGTANSKRIIDNNIHTLYIYNSHTVFVRVLRRLFGEWYIPFRLKQYIKKEKPDIIHIHLAQLKYINKIRNCLNGISLFYTCHAPAEKMFSGKNATEKKAADTLIANNDLHMIALHEEMAIELNRLFSINNTSIIKNGVDFNKFRRINESKAKLRRKYGISETCFLIGNIGRFSPEKNQSFLIDILNEIRNRGIDAKLLLIGSGDLESVLRNRINEYSLIDSVFIFSHRTDIPQLLKCMDVFVFPSLYEGLSVTLVEAQVSGLKCVISDRINSESILSEKTLIVPLEASVETWVDMVLDEKATNNLFGDINRFDLRKEIKNLENLYLL